MNKLPKFVLRFVGVAAIICAGFGLWFNSTTFFSPPAADDKAPYLLHAFYILSAICIACYLLLLYVGIRLYLLHRAAARLLTRIAIFEAMYFLLIAILGVVPGLGRSVAGATGIASGGLVIQLFSLFVIWGPLLALWAKREIERESTKGDAVYVADDSVERASDWLWGGIHFIVVSVPVAVLIQWAVSRLPRNTSTSGCMTIGLPAVLGLVNALIAVGNLRRKRHKKLEQRRQARLQAGLCPRCEYDLRGLTEPRCPECGGEFDSGQVGREDAIHE